MKLAICAVPVALLFAIPGLGQTRITAVRYWSLGEVTRVAIETDGESTYRAERIDNPERLFLDLSDTHPQGRGLETIPVGDRLLKQIRVARTQPTVTRVVLDLAVPVEFAVSQLSNPDRIIVELRLPGKAAAMPPVRSVTGNHPIPDTDPVEARPERPLQMPPVRAVESGPLPEPPALATTRIPYSRPLADPVRASAPAPRVVPAPKPPAEPRSATQAQPRNAPEAALAAKQASHPDRSLTRALGLKLGRVVLDPGHGGQDQGTVGAGGLEEKFLVLDVAQRLGTLITQRLGSEVVYTRADDTYVPLEARTELANEKRADLFLSLHANSSRLRGISGSETFYLNFTTSASALEVAARENATSEKSIHELQSLLQKIALKEKVLESREFAYAVQTSLHSGLWRGKAVKNRGVKQAPFVVLIGAQMPSVLAEIGFLSNPRDEILLKRPEYRQRIAEALFKGVSQYASTLSHFEVARGKGSQAQP